MKLKFLEDNDPILRIRMIYSSMRESEKRVAAYIEENSSKIIYLSIGALAECCGVSEASVIRLCKALGYSGYQELKINMAKHYVEPDKYLHSDVSEVDSTSQLISNVMTADMDSIADTMKVIDANAVEECINLLSQARRIEFYGLGSSGTVAADAYHKFFKLGVPCIYYSDSHMLAMPASLLGQGDVIIAITYSGATQDIVDAVTIGKNAGAQVIAITSSGNSPITKVANHTILALSREVEYKFEPVASRIAQLAIIDVLTIGVSHKRRDEVITNLDKARKALATKKY